MFGLKKAGLARSLHVATWGNACSVPSAHAACCPGPPLQSHGSAYKDMLQAGEDELRAAQERVAKMEASLAGMTGSVEMGREERHRLLARTDYQEAQLREQVRPAGTMILASVLQERCCKAKGLPSGCQDGRNFIIILFLLPAREEGGPVARCCMI